MEGFEFKSQRALNTVIETVKQNPKEHDEWLAENGWREWLVSDWESFDRRWYKRVPTPTPCQLNRDKPGMQLSLKQWNFTRYANAEHIGWQIGLAGETVTEDFVHIQFGNLTNGNMRSELDRLAKRLVDLWETANAGNGA